MSRKSNVLKSTESTTMSHNVINPYGTKLWKGLQPFPREAEFQLKPIYLVLYININISISFI